MAVCEKDFSQMTSRAWCCRCRQSKSPADFWKNPKLSTGLSSWCKDCAREARRASKERHRDRYYEARRNLKVERLCELCGELFETGVSTQRFCCERHRRVAAKRRERAAA